MTEANKSDLIVIKVGTGVLTRVEDGRLDGGALVKLVTALSELIRQGHRVVLVSSGAVGSGVSALGLDSYPKTLPEKRAAAAVGQARLMHTYENLFSQFELSVAQILLTGNNLKSDKVRPRVKKTIDCLLAKGNVVPIVNQNDSVAVEEISKGDNDMMSVRVSELLNADLLVMLTSADGLCEGGVGGPLIPLVTSFEEARKQVGEVAGKFSIGGMSSKLNAVERAVGTGVRIVIGNGRRPERLAEIVKGEGICTRFLVE
ncbi:glutamate 5-kinase [Roseibacillus ishigakijimensis]|uniref:Glutamate 5-kinase n=1 Tax=Roseibacillus ishigakijimensis TaxID=454146 RepID=A0A934RM21_9BACT|nr:glutamate 5-kinase [Roseibacillus ishigakijimensis]MBK1834262.1 glutamate 5-kinase [Roseibacillus ishigakijimensis]